MSPIDPSWKKLGSTSNATVYELRPNVLGIVPNDDSSDDEGTARESIHFQEQHWRAVGHRGGVVVFMDPLLAQDSGARGVYTNETTTHPTTCYALVSSTFFAQAASAVFTGLAKPGRPTQLFPSLEAAMPWIDEMTAAAGPAL
jgi:hypothetical protein